MKQFNRIACIALFCAAAAALAVGQPEHSAAFSLLMVAYERFDACWGRWK